jgi:predicted esterase
MAHGTSDPVIKFTVGSGSADLLVSDFGWKKVTSSEGNGLLFKAYKGMPHSASPEELADLQSWLQKIIPQDS